MAKALVAYYSIFGNTEKIAKALAIGLQTSGVDTNVVSVDSVKSDELRTTDLLCVGSPVYAWNILKPIKEFLVCVKGKENLKGKKNLYI